MFLLCDNKKANLVNTITVMIRAYFDNSSGELFVDFSGHESNYNEELEYRQYEVDVRRKGGVYKPLPVTNVYKHTFTLMCDNN